MVIVASRMPLIEGVGDEVILFVGVTVVIICIVLAWFSTSVTDNPLFRTAVLVIERRPSPSFTNVEATSPVENASTAIIETDTSSSKNTALRSSSSSTATSAATIGAERSSLETGLRHRAKTNNQSTDTVPFETPADSKLAVPAVATEEQTETGTSKSETNVCTGPIEEPDIRRASSSPQIDGPVSELEAEPTSDDVAEERIEVLEAENLLDSVNLADPGLINIRLKFLNDSQRLVSGKLEEPLGDFKRRCFQEELENDKVVRLIFNGQLLRSDQETLQFYGLHDNCVVHCQISNSVSTPTPVQSESYGELDLSRFMLPLFGVILGAIWYCRIQYRQFFNATSTFALLGITGLFFISLAAICIPRRERPPWAN